MPGPTTTFTLATESSRICIDASGHLCELVGDYERITSPPDIGLMRAQDPRAASAYLREVIEFERRNADLFREGLFRDTLGFEIDNPAVRSKAFVNGNALGIAIWNPTDKPQTVFVNAGSAKFIAADEPDGNSVDIDTPVQAASLRLLRFAM